MMETFIDFLAILSVGFGIPSIVALIRVYRSSRRKFLFYYAVYMIILNTYMVFILLPTYFIEVSWVTEWLRFIRYMSIITYIPLLFAIDDLFGRTHLQKYRQIYVVVIGSLFIAHSLDAFALVNGTWQEFAGNYTYYVAYALDVWLSVLIVLLARCQAGGRRKAAMAFGVLQVVTIMFLVCANTLFAFSVIAPGLVSLIYFSVMLVQNAAPFLFLGWFMRLYGEGEDVRDVGFYDYEAMLEHKLTPREIEIAKLICMGKANKEIADELYISLQTVKDHNYNIYRKAGVSNRVQLVNLLRSH